MIINHNMASLNTYNKMSANEKATQSSLEKLSSGLRINKAGDDAAGLAISEKMRGQIRGLDQANRNAQDGISMIQTAEGALNETHSILQRMRELAVQSSNDTATDNDRAEMQKEVSQLKSEIDRISNTTEFNTKKLLNGDLAKSKVAQGTKLDSIKMDATATQGTSTAGQALTASAATPVNIATGVNDSMQLNVDGAGLQTIAIKQGQYTSNADLVAAVNDGIGKNTNLAGKVTAQLDSNNKLTFVSTATGSTSSVVVGDVATKTAMTATGFNTGAGAVTTAVANKYQITAANIDATHTSIKIGITGFGAGATAVTYDVDLTQYGLNSGDNFGGNGSANVANSVKALQAAYDDKFGKGAVTVANGGAAGEFSISSNIGLASLGAAASNTYTVATAGTADVTGGDTHVADGGTAITGTASSTTVGGTTKLVALGDGEGNNLGLKSGNQINISVLVGGQEKTASLAINGTTTLQNLADSIRDTIGGAASISIANGKISITGQLGKAFAVSDLKLTAQVSATDTTAIKGNFANKVSAFQETQAAQDSHVDSSLSMHIGANEGQTMKVDINEMSVNSLNLSSVDISSQQGAEAAQTVINNAITEVSAERSKLGAFQNRLEHSAANLGTSSENLTAAESRIRDVDMAKEMMSFQKNNILQQAAQAMLAQANQQPQGVLQLLR